MTTSNFPASAVELYEAHKLTQAQDNGFALFPVAGGEGSAAFVYTVGLVQHGLPELMVFCTPGMETASIGLLTNICNTLVESSKRFGAMDTLRTFCTRNISATDPDVTYHPTLLRGDELLYSLNTWLTRAVRFRSELGIPRGVIELRHDEVPTLARVRAALMLSAS